MQFRRLGNAGLQVSQLSLGSWVTYHNQVDLHAAKEMMAAAMDSGINFFDNAEAYALGKSEQVMGDAIKALNWPRLNYVVSTKFFWGISRGPFTANRKDTLNRKYLTQAIDGSLTRMGLDFIDLVYCHRPDPNTPLEETVWAMSDMITRGKALYWGTSEWSAEDIRKAWEIADKHHLHKPVMEQPQYNLFHRKRVEQEYAALYDDIGLGLTTWSPLASGLLTGKYANGIPEKSRATMKGMDFLVAGLTDQTRNKAVAQFQEIAASLGCSVAQLAIAWTTKNPRVSTVILGASSMSQFSHNMEALAVLPKLDDKVMAALDAISAPLAD